ncbi:type I polyketide synthase [Pseudohongiella acticola]|uniref:type I polyketide synthase n=1 Tax=Pseudohongiella acticola TaxID=1524254 RepID=UPI001471FA0D|nr:type I polyketide synthase [Pseudohongiella acticola]
MIQKNASEIEGSERVRFSVPENQLVALLLSRRLTTQAGITALDKRGNATVQSYAELNVQAARICAGLQSAGLRPGDRLVLQLVDAMDVLVSFWGCILAGVIPVALNAAPFYNRPNAQADRLLSAIDRFRCDSVLASPELYEPINAFLATAGSTLTDSRSTRVVNLADCRIATTEPEFHTPQPEDPAAMFLTSGSTGAAKGIVQSHAAMLAMADATIQMNAFTKDDVTLNWMSLDHAGSLVFLGVMPLALGAMQVHVPIDYVLKEPTRWLDLIEAKRASITWAPNFVFALLLDRQQQISERKWDLSCMRFMVNAGEAVVSATARRFLTLLQKFGLPEDALRPAFGMVETCSGITWSPGFRLQETADTDSFVSLGPVIPGAAMKIVDESGAVVAEGVEGKLLLKGASVFNGYDGEDALNAIMLVDGWLVTGDLAYIKAGELFVTGREKDMVIINGNNHYCHEIEAIVGKLPAVASDCVAAIGVCVDGENTESLVVFYALSDDAGGDTDKLEKTLRSDVTRVTGIAPRAVHALRPDEFPRTEIGKIKRNLMKRRYENAEYGSPVKKTATLLRDANEDLDDSVAFREMLAGITGIWQRALGLESIGLDETFFELGGSSLLAIQVQHELEQLLAREVSMVELFDTPTIRSMAEHFSGREVHVENDVSADTQYGSTMTGDIAVIGVACRFPGAHGPEAFWRILEQGEETLSFFTAAEAIAAGVPAAQANDPAQVNAAPVLDDIEGCDLDFWKYAKREAELMDPQQRVFLETAWEAFEDAGYVPGAALGKVGVYASAATNTYLQNNVYANRAWVADNGGELFTVNSVPGFNVMVANDKDYLPTRVSYKLDLTGPSMAVQTACSSTLVAVHEAARALREGECDMAVAGGCALMLPQHAGHYYEEGMINSPDGHCRAYDSEARGTIFGSGSGAVLLKRFDQAVADGDDIYAVIKGSAVVNDGGQKMGFTAPSMMGEYRAISQAIKNAGIDADSIGFVEGHGTGTPIGDPIEVQALTKAFRHSTKRNGYCALGSVKTNIGHMGIASGIAGFIKTVLALKHKSLPATLHFRKANPAIGFDKTPFYVSNSTRTWEAGETPRRASVNSLGIGGTNVHVVLEEAPARIESSQSTVVHVLPVSAGSDTALTSKKIALADFIERHPDVALADIAFTHQRGRLAMACRQAFVVSSRDELLSRLRDRQAPGATVTGNNQIVFMFTGQGSQYAGMGRDLYHAHPAFRDALLECTALFAAHREHSVLDLILSAADDSDAEALLSETQYTQPAIFCIQVALVQLYRQFDIRPDLIIGHSIGEVAGVWAAGGLSLVDAAMLVEARSRLMQAVTQQGAMASVKADAVSVRQLLADMDSDCEIAGCNSPFDTTITGDADSVASVCAALRKQGFAVTTLKVSHAFHSRHMESVQQTFVAAMGKIDFRKTHIPVIANVDATTLDHKAQGAQYWSTQLRQPVQFTQGLQQTMSVGGKHFVEIGPAAILCSLGRALEGSLSGQETSSLHWIPSLRKGQQDERVFAGALASLFVLGSAVDWSGSAAFDGSRVHLPTYPWQRQRCWIDPDAKKAGRVVIDQLSAPPLVLARSGQQIYTLEYDTDLMPVLEQHRVFGVVVPPAALYVSQLLRTAADFSGHQVVEMSDVNFIAPMRLADAVTGSAAAGRTVQIQYSIGNTATHIELSSQPGNMRLSALLARSGNGSANGAAKPAASVQTHVAADLLHGSVSKPVAMDMAALRKRCGDALDPAVIEAHMTSMQVGLGDSFCCFNSIFCGSNEALACLDVPVSAAARVAQGVPAGLIDCHWQTMLAALPEMPTATIVPARIDSLMSYTDKLPEQVWAHAQIHQQSPTLIIASVTLMSATGQVLLESRGIEFRVVAAETFSHANTLLIDDAVPTVFSRRWQSQPSVAGMPALKPERIWLAGNDEDVTRIADWLLAVGIGATRVDDLEGVPESELTTSLPLLYVDSVTEGSGIESCVALNRFMASLVPHTDRVSQVIVVTRLSDAVVPTSEATGSSTSVLPAAHRSALSVQAVTAAHELPDLVIRAVEMDQETDSYIALLALFSNPAESGLRLRIKSGIVQTLKADALATGDDEINFASDTVQVITGGLGGLGLLTAEWMFSRGARHFLLAGRSLPSQEASARLALLSTNGANIETDQCDVSEYSQVVALADKAARMGSVETLIHAAGARRDGLIGSLQDADIIELAQAKAIAAENLHNAFAGLKPKQSVYYSSIAAWLGAAGQSNYCAANAALDSLASHYTAAGALTLSVAWGAWEKVGMTASLNDSHLARLSNAGYGFINTDAGFRALGRFLATAGASEVAILTADFNRLAEMPGGAAFWPASPPAGNALASVVVPNTPPVGPEVSDFSEQLLASEDSTAIALMQDYLARLVTEMTSPTRHGQLDFDAGFLDLGIDSLAALELRKKLETTLGIKLKSTLILDYPNITVMAKALLTMVQTIWPRQESEAAGENQRETNTKAATDRSDLLRQLANEIDFQE